MPSLPGRLLSQGAVIAQKRAARANLKWNEEGEGRRGNACRKRHVPFHLSPLPPGSPLITIFCSRPHFLDDLARGYEFKSILDISTVDITMQRVASQRALIHKHSSYVFPKYGIHH